MSAAWLPWCAKAGTGKPYAKHVTGSPTVSRVGWLGRLAEGSRNTIHIQGAVAGWPTHTHEKTIGFVVLKEHGRGSFPGKYDKEFVRFVFAHCIRAVREHVSERLRFAALPPVESTPFPGSGEECWVQRNRCASDGQWLSLQAKVRQGSATRLRFSV